MSDKNEALPHLMAKIQALQDHFSQYYHTSITIYKRDLTTLTVPSFYTNNCNQRQELAPNICRTFIDSMVSQVLKNGKAIVTRCPYSVNYMIAPLGYSNKVLSSDMIEFFLVIKKEPAAAQTGDDLSDPLPDHSLSEFTQQSTLIFSSLDTVFSALNVNTALSPAQKQEERSLPVGYENLTPREQEVARLVSIGLSNHEISEHLFISEHTVKIHIGNILRKTGLKNRTQLAVFKIMNI